MTVPKLFPGPHLSDFGINVAMGRVGGHSGVCKFGANLDVDAAEDIWTQGGDWVAPTEARVHNLVSSDAADAAAGTGARTVLVQGLDADGLEQEETVTLDGITPVATAGSYTMINRMIVETAGSGGANAGTITATAVTDATVTAAISIGSNQTLQAIYQIPANKTGYLVNWYAGMRQAGGVSPNLDMALQAKASGGVFATKSQLGLAAAGSSYLTRDYTAAVPSYAALTILKVRCLGTSAANSIVTAGFDLVLVDA